MSKKIQNKQVDLTYTEKRAEARQEIDTQVNFFVDANLTQAKTVDLSGSGVCFETNEPIAMHVRMELKGMVFEHMADLVWCQRNENGGMTYGLQFHKD